MAALGLPMQAVSKNNYKKAKNRWLISALRNSC